MRRAMLWGVGCGVAALGAAFVVLHATTGQGWTELAFVAAFSGFVLGMALRSLIGMGSEAPSRWRAAATGALVALLSHPLTWVLFIAGNALLGSTPSTVDQPAGVWDGFRGSLALSVFSLLFAGWWTVPLGAGAGMLIARFERRFDDPGPTPVPDPATR